MALRETEFAGAIEKFAAQWQKSFGENDGYDHGDWEDVEVLERYGTRYLRITRRIGDTSRAKDASGNSNASENEIAGADEDDSEALIAPPIATHDYTRVVQCDVAYSSAYQVPVLYLTFAERSKNKAIALPSPDEVYRILVPNEFKSPMRSVGVMGALSMAEHPINGIPAYFVHPCRTQEALSPLLENASPKANPCSGAQYLLLWFGVVGASVGLSVPIGVARLYADKDGGAAAECSNFWRFSLP